MKTALDWLFEQMPYEFRANHTQELFTQAKEKEKEQIIDAAKSCNYIGGATNIEAENYYNKTYNQNK